MKFPKRTGYRNKALLKWAHGKPCQVESPLCTGGQNTVPAHSNLAEDGKGGAQKADDSMIAIACGPCHDFLDRRGSGWKPYQAEEIQWYHDRGIKRTIRLALAEGMLK